jgi:hypothetical protein
MDICGVLKADRLKLVVPTLKQQEHTMDETQRLTLEEMRNIIGKAIDNKEAMFILGMSKGTGTQFKRVCNALGVEMPIDRMVIQSKDTSKTCGMCRHYKDGKTLFDWGPCCAPLPIGAVRGLVKIGPLYCAAHCNAYMERKDD